MKYEIETFHSIPELAERFVKDVPHVVEAIRGAGIKVIDKATHDGLKIATANGNRHGIKIEDHCTRIENARYHPSRFFGYVNKHSPLTVQEAAARALDGVRFVCEPPFTGCELIGVIEAYHRDLEKELERPGRFDVSAKEGPASEIVFDIPQHKLAKMCGVEPETVRNYGKGGLLFERKGREKLFSLTLSIKWLKQKDKRKELESLINAK